MHVLSRSKGFKYKSTKIAASIVLSAAMFGSIVEFAMPSKAYASSALPLAMNQASGTGWSIDSSGNLTILSGQTADLDAIVSSEWGQTYNPNTPPTFNNVTVDGTLTTTSSFHDLNFDAQGTVNVSSSGVINMTGHSAGVSGANGSGTGGGAGIDGNGGTGGGQSGGSSQVNQLYGGNGGTQNTVGTAIGGGHIKINANEIDVSGTIESNGDSGLGGNASTTDSNGNLTEMNGEGGGGGGLQELQADKINIESGSHVESLGGGGGGGAGAPTHAMTQYGGNYPSISLPASYNGQNGKNASGINFGSGGNGSTQTSISHFWLGIYDEYYSWSSPNDMVGLSQWDSSGEHNDYGTAPPNFVNNSAEFAPWFSTSPILNDDGSNYYWWANGIWNHSSTDPSMPSAMYNATKAQVTNDTYNSMVPTIFVTRASNGTWYELEYSEAGNQQHEDYDYWNGSSWVNIATDYIAGTSVRAMMTGNGIPFIVYESSSAGSYEVAYYDPSTKSFVNYGYIAGEISGLPNGGMVFAVQSGSNLALKAFDANGNPTSIGGVASGSTLPFAYNASIVPSGSYDGSVGLITMWDNNSSVDIPYLMKNGTVTQLNAQPTIGSVPYDIEHAVMTGDGEIYASVKSQYEYNSKWLYNIVRWDTSTSQWVSMNDTNDSYITTETYPYSYNSTSNIVLDVGPDNLQDAGDMAWGGYDAFVKGKTYSAYRYGSDDHYYEAPWGAINVSIDATPSGGAGGSSAGQAGTVGTINSTNTSPNGEETIVYDSPKSGDGGSAGGNGGTSSNTDGSAGGYPSNPSTAGQPGGAGGFGGGGGGVGVIELETTNPSNITGLSNVDNTPFTISVPNTLKSIAINQGSLYSQSSKVSVSYSGSDMASSETVEIAQDANFTNNVKKYTVNGTAESISGSSSQYYQYTGQVQYTFSGVALNQPATLYVKLIDGNGSSNTLSSAITPILDTTPPTVNVTIDANQTSTTKLPLQVSTVANDPVSAQGMQMLYSPDGETWYNVVTKPLSTSTVDSNGNPISSTLVSATANASSSNPVFVEAQSATDVQPYSSFVDGFSITSSPKTVDENGNTVSNNIWTMDTSITPNQIKSGEYYAYVLVQDVNKNQSTGANAIYYQNNADSPSNPTPGTATSSSGSSSSSSVTGLVSSSSGTTSDISSNPVTISGGTWGNIGSGSTTTTINGTTYTMTYTNGVPDEPIGTNGEVVDWDGQPTVVTNLNTVHVSVPTSSSTTEFRVSTDDGQRQSSWQTLIGGSAESTVNFQSSGLQAVDLMLGNGQVGSNWLAYPVLIDNQVPEVTLAPVDGGGGVSTGSTYGISLSISNNMTGIPLYYQTSVDGGTPSTWAPVPSDDEISVTIPNQGVNHISVTVEDLAGNKQHHVLQVLGL